MTPAASPAHTNQLRRLGALVVVLFVVIDGLLRTAYFHFGERVEGSSTPFRDSLFSELTSSAAVLVGFFLIALPLSRRKPLRGLRWKMNLASHVVGLTAYSLLKTTLMWGQRAALWPLAGLGRYDFGDLTYRIPMEASLDVFGYAFLVAAVHVWDAWVELREREVREARLGARLAEARFELLEAQIQPHFLFNTLNTISGVMYRDPATADRLLSHLSDLLRASLRREHGPEVSVSDEMNNLEHYLEIVRARFSDRLTVCVEMDASASEGRVPALLLQPLVENAVRHTVGVRAKQGHIDVCVSRHDGRLLIRVEDDGTGIEGDPGAAIGRGVGLSNTRDRLEWLHGSDAELTLKNRPEGGLVVEVSLPFRLAADAPASPGSGRP
jgi:signal transduction histidine kinase